MSMFTALNIEPESDSEDEIDNTKEIQTEEALKLYQNALKLHSQGPRFFDEAEEAYSALFHSEVFTYLESLSESQRTEYYGNAIDELATTNEQLVSYPGAAATSSADGTPSTLPQILYLSYKNHGYFLLDRLKYSLNLKSKQDVRAAKPAREPKEISELIISSLGLLVEALDRDDSDIELWRQISRIGESLGSRRIARFCLEAVLDREEVGGDAWPEPLGLQELFAAEGLRTLVSQLEDDVGPFTLPNLTRKQQGIVRSFKLHLDPLPYLPTLPSGPPAAVLDGRRQPNVINLREIWVPLRNWASCGKAILLQLQQEAQGSSNASLGTKYTLMLPPAPRVISQEPPDTDPVTEAIVEEISRKSVSVIEASIPTQEDSHDKQNSPQELASGPKSPRQPVPIGTSESANVPMQDLELTDRKGDVTAARKSSVPSADVQEDHIHTMTLPTRKRSNEAAELEDIEDTGRSRSKRIKARTSIDEPVSRREVAAKQQLALYQQGELQYFNFLDEQAFGQTVRLLSSFGVVATESVKERRAAIVSLARSLNDGNDESGYEAIDPDQALLTDLSISLLKWNNELSSTFLHGGGVDDPISGAGASRNSGLLVFLEQSGIQARDCTSKPMLLDDRGLDAFAQHVEEEELQLDQLALVWIKALLSRNSFFQSVNDDATSSPYEGFLWPDSLKETVVQMLVKHDEFVFGTLVDEIGAGSNSANSRHLGMIQNAFELHLDVYGRITNPSSEVDLPTRTAQFDRLRRWASLAYHVRMKSESNAVDGLLDDVSSTRFLWAYAVLANQCELCSRDLIILYFQDLKATLEKLGSPVIELRNNAVIPEISVVAAEKQISRLTTMDFFISVFNPIDDDAVTLIETLEPILEKSLQNDQLDLADTKQVMVNGSNHTTTGETHQNQHESTTSLSDMEPLTEQMLQFLDKASLSMRLMLWRRLIDTYSIIQYTPRILLCYLRCIKLIVEYLRSAQYLDNSFESRQKLLLRWFKSLDDLLTWSLALAWSDAQSLDCMDEVNLKDAMSTLKNLQHMLHPIIAIDDLINIGFCEVPEQFTSSANTAYHNSISRLRDMVVRAWTLQYILLRESVGQSSSATAEAYADLFHYLTSIHRCFGPRSYCKLADRIFLKLARRELLLIGNYGDSEIEGAQIILDAYGMKICPGSKEVEDHGCPAETLYRSDAIGIMDRILIQANKLNIRDLIKSELRNTLEKTQQVIRVPKNTSLVLHNRRVLDKFLRSPINPLDLYRALQGIGELHFQQTHGESFSIAEKGWYFLQGHVALAKFRSQKRTNPGGSDDLDFALKFFQHDLEQGYEKWETWYRLAQVYDAKLEEATIWTAERLNDSMEDVVTLQRNAIHCYTMAVATAERCAEPTFDMFQKVADLYCDFGIRLYASSREPFSMEALSVEKFTKHFNAGRLGTYQGVPFRPIGLYGMWRFSSGLLRRALVHKPDSWIDHVLSGHQRIDFSPAIEAIKTAIEALPGRRDSKHPEKDPTLEPHYKLASVVHKLVSSRRLSAEAGCEALATTSYARRVPPVQDFEDWEGYILQVLKVLRSADKSNWHHRMVLRSARTIYEESPNDHMATLAAKHELTQQIFTKSMTVQVWKPENERAGRHFVYTTRYVEFFLQLLFELKDRAGLDALGRQIRKKPGKFFKHGRLWHETCMTHLKLLRTHSLLPEELSDSVFKNISHDIFVLNADRLEAWAHLPSTECPIIEILREAVELKKTNANLMKPTIIEDFIADAYAHLHRSIVPELIARSNEEESRGRMRVDHLMNVDNPPVGTPSPGPAGNPEEAAPPRQRIRGVGRRELQKRADALVNKPASVQVSVKAPKTPPLASGPTTPRSTLQVVIKQDDQIRDNSSIPGSVHDSADDESELTDAEDVAPTIEPRPLFPNLGDSMDTAEDEDKEESGEDLERAEHDQPNEGPEEDEQGDEEAEAEGGGDGEGEGEEIYHTPMEM
ncbi:MAG: hypothetical protein LQ343_003566 [Gyalolechia ehrenbergii]|nr:MAG: hypothetical protein LQ343_003566 [Gyalolechia ehrenbergii]